MREYTISLILTALLCGMLPGILSKGTARELIQMTCGLVLVLAAIGPLRSGSWDLWEAEIALSQDGGGMTAQGEAQARDAMADIIKRETQAYILDKAAQLGAEVSVELVLSESTPPLPAAVCISGAVSSSAREQLETIICTELGIAKENLTWTGET